MKQRGPTQKRQALGKASLPDPQSLLRAPAYPPAAGLQVGQIQKQARVRKNAWVWEQFDKRPVPAAGAAAAPPNIRADFWSFLEPSKQCGLT